MSCNSIDVSSTLEVSPFLVDEMEGAGKEGAV